MGKPKENWMDGAGILGPAGNKPGPDEYYNGKPDSDESGNYPPSEYPTHLSADKKLQSYVDGVESDYAADYDESWGPYFHGENNYPAPITKTKGTSKKVVGD